MLELGLESESGLELGLGLGLESELGLVLGLGWGWGSGSASGWGLGLGSVWGSALEWALALASRLVLGSGWVKPLTLDQYMILLQRGCHTIFWLDEHTSRHGVLIVSCQSSEC